MSRQCCTKLASSVYCLHVQYCMNIHIHRAPLYTIQYCMNIHIHRAPLYTIQYLMNIHIHRAPLYTIQYCMNIHIHRALYNTVCHSTVLYCMYTVQYYLYVHSTILYIHMYIYGWKKCSGQYLYGYYWKYMCVVTRNALYNGYCVPCWIVCAINIGSDRVPR